MRRTSSVPDKQKCRGYTVNEFRFLNFANGMAFHFTVKSTNQSAYWKTQKTLFSGKHQNPITRWEEALLYKKVLFKSCNVNIECR